MTETRLILVDPNAELCDAWRSWFKNAHSMELEPNVDVRCGRFEDVTDADAFATAGNSFGLMDGGVDLAVARFDPGIEARVQRHIRSIWHGELPVGHCATFPMQVGSYRWLLYAPTMRIPMSVVGTDNVYLATWATLLEAWRGDGWQESQLRTLAMPGFGATTGQVPPNEVARQMAFAWHNFHSVPERMDWPTASHRHNSIVGRT